MTHAASHSLALKDFLRIHRSDRTWLTDVTVTTVGCFAGIKVVSFYRSGKTFTLACTSGVNDVSKYKLAYINRVPYLEAFR